MKKISLLSCALFTVVQQVAVAGTANVCASGQNVQEAVAKLNGKLMSNEVIVNVQQKDVIKEVSILQPEAVSSPSLILAEEMDYTQMPARRKISYVACQLIKIKN